MSCEYEPNGSHADKVHQAQCRPCRKKAWSEWVPPRIFFGAVPGGTRPAALAKAHDEQFHKDMYKYKAAVDSGLDPEQVSVKAVEKAEKIAYGAKQEYDSIPSPV